MTHSIKKQGDSKKELDTGVAMTKTGAPLVEDMLTTFNSQNLENKI